MTMANRYIEAAKRMFACNPDVDVLDIVDESPDDGAWVTALIWVPDDYYIADDITNNPANA